MEKASVWKLTNVKNITDKTTKKIKENKLVHKNVVRIWFTFSIVHLF